MNGDKDSFEILADELARMGLQIAHLQRTSLNKTEAEALNQEIVKGLQQMTKVGPTIYEAISARLDLALDKMRRETVNAAPVSYTHLTLPTSDLV